MNKMDYFRKEDKLIKILRVIRRFIEDCIKEIKIRIHSLNKNPDKKILAYWDFNKRGESLGDFIIFLEILNILKSLFNLNQSKKNIDICFIDDEKNFDPENIFISKTYFWKKNLKSLVILNKNIENIFYFGKNEEFNRFYALNKTRYIRWPIEIFSEICDIRRVERFFKKKKYFPKLDLPIEIKSRIYAFYDKKVYPALPIIVNIRRNTRSTERNSNLLEFKKFFKNYEKNKKYKFIIICEKTEIPENFRELKNVIFSKDYFSELECDLGLILTSYLSIFPSSGMAAFAWFTDVPFIQHGKHMENHPGVPKKGEKYNFLLEYQRYHHRRETAQWLISEFESLIKYLKEKGINNNQKRRVKDTERYIAEF